MPWRADDVARKAPTELQEQKIPELKTMKFVANTHAGRTPTRRLAAAHIAHLRAATVLTILLVGAATVFGQANDVGQKPYLGWSTFSEQTINGSFLTQANIQAQSDPLPSSGIQAHGFCYI